MIEIDSNPYFHLKITGLSFTSSRYFIIRCFNSSFEDTRIPHTIVLVIFIKNISIIFSPFFWLEIFLIENHHGISTLGNDEQTLLVSKLIRIFTDHDSRHRSDHFSVFVFRKIGLNLSIRFKWSFTS